MTSQKREELILRYSKLVYKCAHGVYRRVGHRMRALDVDDLIQAGFIGVMHAIDRWDYPSEPPLANIIYWIRGEMGNLWHKDACARWAAPVKHVELSEPDHPLFDPSQGYLARILLDQLIRTFQLTLAQQIVICAMLQGKGIDVIARERRAPRRSTHKVYAAAVRRMRRCLES